MLTHVEYSFDWEDMCHAAYDLFTDEPHAP